MPTPDKFRQLTKHDITMIAPFFDFVSQQATANTEFPIPEGLKMPFTEGLGDPAQTKLILELLSIEPHRTRVLAIRNAQDEELVLIPEPTAIKKQMEALRIT